MSRVVACLLFAGLAFAPLTAQEAAGSATGEDPARLENSGAVNPAAGFVVSFRIVDRVETRSALWLGRNAGDWSQREGIELVFFANRVRLNLKRPDQGWMTMPPAVLQKPLRDGSRVEVRVVDGDILEIHADGALKVKYFLRETLEAGLPGSEGVLPGGGAGLQVLWQGESFEVEDFRVRPYGGGDSGYRIDQSYATSDYPYFVTSGDLNGDGFLDMVVTDRGAFDGRMANRFVSIYYGRADGTFQQQVKHEVGQGPYTAEISDVNDDGVPDILVSSFFTWSNRGLTVLLGSPWVSARVPAGQETVDLGKYALRNQYVTSFIPLPATQPLVTKGSTPNAPGQPQQSAWPIPGTTALAVEDFNGDGHRDIAAVSWTSDALYVLLGDGTGRFAFEDTYQKKDYGIGMRDVVSTDLDGDGNMDLGITSYNSSSVTVFRGLGDGTFEFVEEYDSGGITAYHMNFGDFNNDGRPDFVVGNFSGEAKLFVNEGSFVFSDGGVYDDFGPVWKYNANTEAAEGWNDYWKIIRDVVPHDYDGDGFLDVGIACAGPNAGYFSILYGTGDFESGSYFGRSEQYFLGERPRSIFVADYDDDGADEISIVRFDAGDVLILEEIR